MKILPVKKDIDKAKAQERKIEIDNGIALATKIDFLRETQLKEEKSLKEWREQSIQAVQYEIGQYIEERDNLKRQNDAARLQRDELLKPLDEEWYKIGLAKDELTKDKDFIHDSKASLQTQTDKIQETLKKVSVLETKIEKKKEVVEKLSAETVKLNNDASKSYQDASLYKENTEKECESMITKVKQLEEQYLVGIETNELKAKLLDEKEQDLVTRENRLATRQKILEIAANEVKNGYSQSTNN